MHTRQQRPDSPAPAGQKKVALNVVYATSLDGKLYALPTDVAGAHEVTKEQAREIGHLPIVPDQWNEEDEVGGRHQVLLPDGTTRYHGNWITGAYIWHRDYRAYAGPHWHPDPNSPIAYDEKDY